MEMSIMLVTIVILVYVQVIMGQMYDPYNQMEGKCGCCPKPCCCHCIVNSTSQPNGRACNENLDLGFIVDSSGSVGASDWPVVLKFVNAIINAFDIGPKKSRVALVQFATNVSLEFGFMSDVNANNKAVNEAVRKTQQMGSFTNMAGGIETMIEVLESQGESSKNPKVVVFITDGRSCFRSIDMPDLTKRLNELAFVVSVGISSATDVPLLETISSLDKNGQEAVFVLSDFDGLQGILSELVKTICSDRPLVTTPVQTTLPSGVDKECFCCCPPPPGNSYGSQRYGCKC